MFGRRTSSGSKQTKATTPPTKSLPAYANQPKPLFASKSSNGTPSSTVTSPPIQPTNKTKLNSSPVPQTNSPSSATIPSPASPLTSLVGAMIAANAAARASKKEQLRETLKKVQSSSVGERMKELKEKEEAREKERQKLKQEAEAERERIEAEFVKEREQEAAASAERQRQQELEQQEVEDEEGEEEEYEEEYEEREEEEAEEEEEVEDDNELLEKDTSLDLSSFDLSVTQNQSTIMKDLEAGDEEEYDDDLLQKDGLIEDDESADIRLFQGEEEKARQRLYSGEERKENVSEEDDEEKRKEQNEPLLDELVDSSDNEQVVEEEEEEDEEEEEGEDEDEEDGEDAEDDQEFEEDSEFLEHGHHLSTLSTTSTVTSPETTSLTSHSHNRSSSIVSVSDVARYVSAAGTGETVSRHLYLNVCATLSELQSSMAGREADLRIAGELGESICAENAKLHQMADEMAAALEAQVEENKQIEELKERYRVQCEDLQKEYHILKEEKISRELDEENRQQLEDRQQQQQQQHMNKTGNKKFSTKKETQERLAQDSASAQLLEFIRVELSNSSSALDADDRSNNKFEYTGQLSIDITTFQRKLVAERRNYEKRIYALEMALKENKGQVELLKQTNERYKQDLTSISTLQTQLNSAINEKESLHDRYSDKERNMAAESSAQLAAVKRQYQSQLASLESERKNLENELVKERAEKEKERLAAEKSDIDTNILRGKVAQMTTEIKTFQKDMEDKRKKGEEERIKREDEVSRQRMEAEKNFETEFERQRVEIDRSRRECENLRAELNRQSIEVQKEREEFSNEKHQFEREKAELLSNLAESEKEFSRQRGEYEKEKAIFERKAESKSEEAQELLTIIKKMEEEIALMNDDRSKLNTELLRLETEQGNLEVQVRTLEKDKKTLETEQREDRLKLASERLTMEKLTAEKSAAEKLAAATEKMAARAKDNDADNSIYLDTEYAGDNYEDEYESDNDGRVIATPQKIPISPYTSNVAPLTPGGAAAHWYLPQPIFSVTTRELKTLNAVFTSLIHQWHVSLALLASNKNAKLGMWIDDYHTDACMSCHAQFTFFKRRHHCRTCGGLYCDACSNQSVSISKFKLTDARVCATCFGIVGVMSRGASILAERERQAGKGKTPIKEITHTPKKVTGQKLLMPTPKPAKIVEVNNEEYEHEPEEKSLKQKQQLQISINQNETVVNKPIVKQQQTTPVITEFIRTEESDAKQPIKSAKSTSTSTSQTTPPAPAFSNVSSVPSFSSTMPAPPKPSTEIIMKPLETLDSIIPQPFAQHPSPQSQPVSVNNSTPASAGKGNSARKEKIKRKSVKVKKLDGSDTDTRTTTVSQSNVSSPTQPRDISTKSSSTGPPSPSLTTMQVKPLPSPVPILKSDNPYAAAGFVASTVAAVSSDVYTPKPPSPQLKPIINTPPVQPIPVNATPFHRKKVNNPGSPSSVDVRPNNTDNRSMQIQQSILQQQQQQQQLQYQQTSDNDDADALFVNSVPPSSSQSSINTSKAPRAVSHQVTSGKLTPVAILPSSSPHSHSKTQSSPPELTSVLPQSVSNAETGEQKPKKVKSSGGKGKKAVRLVTLG